MIVLEAEEHINGLMKVEQGLVRVLGKVRVMAHGENLCHLVKVDIQRVHLFVRLREALHEIDLHLDRRQLLSLVFVVLKLANLLDVNLDLLSELYDRLHDPYTEPVHDE